MISNPQDNKENDAGTKKTKSGNPLADIFQVEIKDVRHAVFKRDNWRCRRCGDQEFRNLTQHHIKERSQQGEDIEENLVVLCLKCHTKIHDGILAVKLVNGKAFFKNI